MKIMLPALVAMLIASTAARAEKGGVLVSGAAMVVLPQADADDMADTSLGVRGAFVYWAHPNVGVVASFDYIVVNEDEDFFDQVDLTFYSVGVGARFTTTKPTQLQPFGEVLVGRHTSVYDSPLGDDSNSDLGFRLSGGALYRLQPNLALVGQLSYSSAEIDDAEIEGIMLELGLAWTN